MKSFWLGFLLASCIFVSFFGLCPYSRQLLDVQPVSSHSKCDVILRVIIDDPDGVVEGAVLPGSSVLDE